ncbi:MAG: hypothetical protein AB8B64_04335 [Granulosicoccus sp.]
MPIPTVFYGDAQRALQKEGQHEKLSEVVVRAIVCGELEDIRINYINGLNYFFLSPVTGTSEPTVSYKGVRKNL